MPKLLNWRDIPVTGFTSESGFQITPEIIKAAQEAAIDEGESATIAQVKCVLRLGLPFSMPNVRSAAASSGLSIFVADVIVSAAAGKYAFDEGRRSFLLGEPRNKNPYGDDPYTLFEQQQWNDGWITEQAAPLLPASVTDR